MTSKNIYNNLFHTSNLVASGVVIAFMLLASFGSLAKDCSSTQRDINKCAQDKKDKLLRDLDEINLLIVQTINKEDQVSYLKLIDIWGDWKRKLF